MNRKILIRSGVILVLVLLAVMLYSMGKGYTLLLDNKTIEANGRTLEAFEMVEVNIDGGEPIELYLRDRDMVTVTGKRHFIQITSFDKSFRETGKHSLKFRIKDKGDMFLLSMPALAAEHEDWITPFQPPNQ